MGKRVLFHSVMFGCVVVLMAACSGKDSKEPAKSAEPVTLKIARHISVVPDAEFSRFIVEPVKKKYPHITIEGIDISQKDKASRSWSLPN